MKKLFLMISMFFLTNGISAMQNLTGTMYMSFLNFTQASQDSRTTRERQDDSGGSVFQSMQSPRETEWQEVDDVENPVFQPVPIIAMTDAELQFEPSPTSRLRQQLEDEQMHSRRTFCIAATVCCCIGFFGSGLAAFMVKVIL